MKITPCIKRRLKRITENLSTLRVTVNTYNYTMRTETQHYFIDVSFEVLDSEFRICGEKGFNWVHININEIEDIKEHNRFNYTVLMKESVSIKIERFWY